MNFDNMPIAATAISIVICWGLFAVFCGLVQECIAQLKAERGRFMKNYLLLQLQDAPNGINWATLIYNHGSVDILSRAPEKPTNDIPPHLFAETLVDVVGQSHIVQMHSKEVAATVTYQHATLRNFKIATLVLKPSDVMTFLGQALKSAELAASTANGITDESLLYKTLIENIEKWHSTFSDRLSLWYKKQVRQRLFLLGMVLALVLNIDSIQLFQVFNASPDSRKTIIENYKQNSSKYELLAAHVDSLGKNRAANDTSIKNVAQSIDSVKAMLVSMNAVGQSADLPIGTQYNIFSNWKKENTIGFIVLKMLGILISGFAASFGAPFWFDLLKKVYSSKV